MVIPDGLQLCAVSEVRPQNESKPFVRLRDSVRSFLLGEPSIRNLPNDVVMDIIGNIWQMEIPPWSAEVAQDTIYGFAQSLPLLYPPSKDVLYDLLHGSGADHSPTRTWGEVPHREGNMDPYLKDNEILLHWQVTTPSFSSDWYTYTTEIHKTLPQPQYAKVMFSPKNDQTGCRLLIHFGHLHTLQEFFTRMNKSDAIHVTARTGISGEDHWSPDAVVILSIICIFQMMIDDTTNFIQRFHQEVKSFIELVGSMSSGSFNQQDEVLSASGRLPQRKKSRPNASHMGYWESFRNANQYFAERP
ncbi:hypothetical protein G7054_g1899 [Neopestalotiopsis clavispora]|nr:hypothetical protein G7054_g1899 [Neopestalotiopsis clavispora]